MRPVTVLLACFTFICLCSESLACQKVVCYFTNWAYYRDGNAKQSSADVDWTLCTHVIYSFATLNPTTFLIQSSDTWVDVSLGLYKNMTSLGKSNGVKVSLALGGWSDSGGTKYSVLLNNATKRAQFVTNTVNFLSTYGFEGLDLDIEYPTCPQGNCASGNVNDKAGFAALIQQLSAVFKPKGWVLSAAISATPSTIKTAYSLNDMNLYLDWIGVMTYDYHGSWEGKTGANSPLYFKQGDPTPTTNINNTITYLRSQGALATKLVLGIPLYAQSFQLTSTTNTGFWAASNGAGKAGTYTKQAGFLAYYEICQNIKAGWKAVTGDMALGSYAYSGNQWASYVAIEDVKYRTDYLKLNNLAGAMFWDISLDDIRGAFCGNGRYPLMYEVNKQLGRKL